MSTLRAFTMPKWGIEMLEGTIGEWSVREGEPVTKGQLIVSIETDKIVNEVQAEFDSVFVRVLAQTGETYPVGALLGVMADGAASAEEIEAFVQAFQGAPGASIGEREAPASRAAAAAAPKADAGAGSASAAPSFQIPPEIAISPAARELAIRSRIDVSRLGGSGRKGRITLQDVVQASRPERRVGGGSPVSVAVTTAALDGFHASPSAKRLAVSRNVNLAVIKGTGPRGRISRQDVAQAAGPQAPVGAATQDVEIVRMSAMRKAIAARLTYSKSTVPHFYLRAEANFDALLALRAALRQQAGEAPSLNDYVVRAAALALIEVPDVNIQVHGEEIHRFRHADVSVAVATDKGLLTPVVRAADTKPVAGIASELRQLAERARAGKLRADEFEGGSFTVSNLGMFGVEQFDAIINTPQGAILAVGSARRRPVEVNGRAGFASLVALSLSCDHRAIDGAVGGRFLSALRDLIESPQRL
ncbi:MAG TPA: dihydrolipoamide acetyltransferase family protein [Steroidobacteraceae bacterium]|nr:dihydrolipoamide acetyltransferase family protein [Steroidobacteraceae bacterium]